MTYLSSESGAVTVDWVVLTAGLVGLGLATMTVVSSGVQDVSSDIETSLSTQIITTSFPPPNPSVLGRPDNAIGYQMLSGGECYIVGDTGVCDPTVITSYEPFYLSNGEVWNRQTVSTDDGSDDVVTWTDANGDVVETAPDVDPETIDNVIVMLID